MKSFVEPGVQGSCILSAQILKPVSVLSKTLQKRFLSFCLLAWSRINSILQKSAILPGIMKLWNCTLCAVLFLRMEHTRKMVTAPSQWQMWSRKNWNNLLIKAPSKCLRYCWSSYDEQIKWKKTNSTSRAKICQLAPRGQHMCLYSVISLVIIWI